MRQRVHGEDSSYDGLVAIAPQSPAPNAEASLPRSCRPTPASFSMTASTVQSCCVHSRVIAASSAPTRTFHASRSGRVERGELGMLFEEL